MKRDNHPLPEKLRVLIVDDEPEAINILHLLLQDINEVEVVGSTCDPEKV